MRTVLFAHGLEGSPSGSKATALRAAGLPVVAPDGRGAPLAARVAQLERAVGEHPGSVLVGSSYGALAAAVVAARTPERLGALVLLAPAIVLREPPVEDPAALTVPASVPCVVVHGTRDELIPLDAVRAWVSRMPHVTLHTPDDVHDLRGSLARIVEIVSALVAR